MMSFASRYAGALDRRLDTPQLVEGGDPAVTDRVGQQRHQVGVGHQQPAVGRDAVGLVAEPLRKDVGKVVDGLLPQQLAMDRSPSAGRMGADDGRVGVVELDGDFVREVVPVVSPATEPTKSPPENCPKSKMSLATIWFPF